jgi:hypothetical protein
VRKFGHAGFAGKSCFAADELGPPIQREDELQQRKAVSTSPSTFVVGSNDDPKPSAPRRPRSGQLTRAKDFTLSQSSCWVALFSGGCSLTPATLGRNARADASGRAWEISLQIQHDRIYAPYAFVCPSPSAKRISASWCYDAVMPKVRTTLTIDEDVLRAVKVRGARTGKGDGEVIEEALRRQLGFDLLDRLWQSSDLDETEALELAVEAQHKTRRRR